MTGVSLSILGIILVAGTTLALATTLRFEDLPRLILGVYVLGFVEVIGLMLLLSAFGAVTRPAILAGLTGLFGASVAAWILCGARRLPLIQLRHVADFTRRPVFLTLAAGVGLAFLYVVSLIVGTPPNNWDALTYHLARAGFWRQEGHVGYVSDSYDERLNVNPPNAEVAVTFLLEVGRHERLAGFVQLGAALAIAVGVFALARKLGSDRLKAAFGALLVLTLPIVLLQASTAQNDLVAASFLVAATVFVLGDSSRDLVIAAVAIALAIGTKIPAVYGVPVLVAVVLVAPPRSYLRRRVAAVAVGACIGSYWYVVNIIRTGHILGDHPSSSDLVAFLEPTENLLATLARTLDAFDLSGARGADLLVYAIVAAGVALALLLAPSSRTGGVASAVATGAPRLARSPSCPWAMPFGVSSRSSTMFSGVLTAPCP